MFNFFDTFFCKTFFDIFVLCFIKLFLSFYVRFSNDQRVPILSLHEDMIRGQQRKIDELQRELQRSQDILKQQQQLILAAKKVQVKNSFFFWRMDG